MLGGARELVILASLASLVGAVPGADLETFDGAMKAARTAIWKNDLGAAHAALKRALEVSGDPPEGGPHLLKAKELLGDVFLKDKKFKAASWAFRDASHFALDDQRTRTRLMYRRKAALDKAEDKKGTAWVDDLLRHDLHVAQAARAPAVGEKKKAEVRAQLAEAAAAYRADKDAMYAEWAMAARALVSVRSGAPEEGVAEAKAIVEAKKAGRPARMTALEALYSASLTSKDVDSGARALLEYNALRSEPWPEPKRRYMRMRGLDQMCEKYDEAHGSGSCAKLEHEVTGRFTFTDYSLGKVKRELGDEDLDRTHRQFLPALEDCVRTKAQANREIFENTDIQISWAIQPKGVATDIDVHPKRYRDELMPCVQERLAWFRYPRYTSPERKTVTIPYHLD